MAKKANTKGRPVAKVHPSARRRKLVRRFDKAGVDALVVMDGASVRYLSGFSGGDSFLLVGPKWAVLITDSRYTGQAAIECPDVECLTRGSGVGMVDAVKRALRGRKARRIGLESANLTVTLHEKFQDAFSTRRLRLVQGLAATGRDVKDAAELSAIRKAVRIAEEAFGGLIAPGAKAFVGRSETEVAGELEYRMRQLGAEGASFPTILAAGPHAAMPHYSPDGTKIRAGQPVLIDWGAVWRGYCSDLTRVVFLGRISPRIGEIYEIVLEAQTVGIAAIRAGRACKAADDAARAVITGAGYGPQFGHSLGHGLGLRVHEAPGLSGRATARLKRGAVVTVEPGIYLPGVGGVRIEDDVLVAPDGAKVLSSVPKRLQEMVLK